MYELNYFTPNPVNFSDKFDICQTCGKLFNNSGSKFCSFQCYKISKKDHLGIFHFKCMFCSKMFATKCIFTDCCSDECFISLIKSMNIIIQHPL